MKRILYSHICWFESTGSNCRKLHVTVLVAGVLLTFSAREALFSTYLNRAVSSFFHAATYYHELEDTSAKSLKMCAGSSVGKKCVLEQFGRTRFIKISKHC